MEFLSKYFDATNPYAFFEFSCGHYKSMDDLCVEMADVLSFPDYFWWGNRWDSLNDCMPVSYTHLDVYKRQGLTDMVMKGNVSGEKEYVDNVFHLRFAHMLSLIHIYLPIRSSKT